MIQRSEVCSWFSVVKCAHDLAWWRKTNGIRCRFNSHWCHSARRACPKLQNPHFKTRKITFSLGKVPHQGGWGVEESTLPQPTHRLRRSRLSRKARIIFWMWILRLRLRLRAEWQGGRHTAKIESFWTRESTERKSVAMSIDFLMMLCALVRNDAECIG